MKLGSVALAFFVTACGRGRPSTEGTPASSRPAGDAVAAGDAANRDEVASGALDCQEVAFAATTPIAEASGAAWLVIDGQLSLIVISDSGNDGAYSIVDPDTGATRETGKLPLGSGGEDLEGLAVRDEKLHAITSPGWIRTWKRGKRGFELVDGPYALGPIDLTPSSTPRTKGGPRIGDTPPDGTGMVCDSKYLNCGRNYEGLCLAPGPVQAAVPCVGFAASKADGHLYCLVDKGGRLVVQHAPAIAIARPGVVADCAFSDDGRLFVGSNLFDFATVYEVTSWQDPASAKVTSFAKLAAGFPETLAVRGENFYRMSDMGGAPSLMKKYRCVKQ